MEARVIHMADEILGVGKQQVGIRGMVLLEPWSRMLFAYRRLGVGGTGFLLVHSPDARVTGIATAAHVIKHAQL